MFHCRIVGPNEVEKDQICPTDSASSLSSLIIALLIGRVTQHLLVRTGVLRPN